MRQNHITPCIPKNEVREKKLSVSQEREIKQL
jgi:hypothetical protein